ncbi:MAG TPA: hypothetical protein VGX50_12015 [Longimicrobium sp.]|jgi:hypothetical protein|nr:hypothetical protein [Longimicrobium sp.]
MSGTIDPNDWRTWPRKGSYIEAPEGSSMEQRLAAMWALTCEEYGIDPDNPPPLRKDIVRIIRRPAK